MSLRAVVGKKYRCITTGEIVEVMRVEEDIVVFRRPGGAWCECCDATFDTYFRH